MHHHYYVIASFFKTNDKNKEKVVPHWHVFHKPPVDLYLNFEKSSWKNQVQQKINFEKNPVWNRLKIQFTEIDFSKLIFQKSSTDQQGERRFDVQAKEFVLVE